MVNLKSKHLVVGLGEVGNAIFKVIEEKYAVLGMDAEWKFFGTKFDVLHVCFPFSEEFSITVEHLKKEFLSVGGLVIVHSTVPVGTCDPLGAVHSPVRGVHPNLYEGIKTFVKYFGGARAGEAAELFYECGIEAVTTSRAKDTEALKLWDTTYYGLAITFEKEIHDYCLKNGLDYNVIYKQANETYNSGYAKLGKENVIRPVLEHMDGKIGGHCIVQNCRLLGGKSAEFILRQNGDVV